MSTARTVTVPTLDHGLVVMPEPAWCTGHTEDRPELLCDTGHIGVRHTMTYAGLELAMAALVQDPFVEHSSRNTRVLVELGELAHGLTPAELDGLAAVLVDYAATLRHLARQLSVLRTEETGR